MRQSSSFSPTNLSQLKVDIQRCSKDFKSAQNELYGLVYALPNALAPEVATITEPQIVDLIHDENKVPADPQRSHLEIGKRLNLFDFSKASRVSGHAFYYLCNDLVFLEQALINYTLVRAREQGWLAVSPPSIVRLNMAMACGFQPRDQEGDQIYRLTTSQFSDVTQENGSNLCLAGTAEIPLAGLQFDSTLPESALPLKLVGQSRAYRAEAGAHGKASSGLYRVHEFNKVELFAWTHPSQSDAMLREILDFQVRLLTDLGISARVLLMPPHDTGAAAYKKYDIEAWMPGRGSYGEVTSASNCTDYQTIRLKSLYQPTTPDPPSLLHTLNGTAVAIPRLLIAIIENNWDSSEQRVRIPQALKPYLAL